MRKIRKPLFIVAASLLLAIGLLAFHRLIEPNRTCLSWEGIRELSFQSQSIPACEAVSRLQRPLVREPVREWVSRLNQLDRLEWLKESSRPISIRLDAEDPFAFHVENQLVTIGFALAERPGQFEHAVLLGWVKTNWPQRSETTQEVMADILTWLTVGDSAWSDPVHDRQVSPSSYLRYSLTPSSQKTYCQSPFRSIIDLKSCETKNAEVTAATHALRPLVAWTIWNFAKELSASKRIYFFKELLQARFADEKPSNEMASMNRASWAKNQIFTLLKNWNLGEDALGRGMTRALYKADLNSPLTFDLTVEVSDLQLQDRVRESLQKWSAFYPQTRVLFVAPQKKIVFPENVDVDFSKSEIETRHYVMLACGWPKPNHTFSPKYHAFSAYQICGSDSLPSWTEIVSPRSLALQTPSTLATEPPPTHF